SAASGRLPVCRGGIRLMCGLRCSRQSQRRLGSARGADLHLREAFMILRPILFRVYNAGDLGSLACGWRSLIALKPGRKWITVVDWTTLETARLPVALWNTLPKIECTRFSRRRVAGYMRARAKYTGSNATIKHAIALMASKGVT